MAAYTTIDDPSAHFQVKIWTGNATNRTIDLDNNATMQPDFSWVKSRSEAYEHYIENSSTGTDKYIRPNRSSALDNGTVVTYNSTGFGIGSGAENNENSTTNVGYFWKGNGGTTSTLSGNISSVAQVNTTAGFSIVTWSGNDATGQSVNHGLGATPEFIAIKRTNGTADWFVYHQILGNTKHLHLNLTNAESTTSDFGNYGPTSTAFFTNNTATCISGEDYIAFVFAPKQGYSKFGGYLGNGSGTSDGTFEGPFVYTGFKPSWLLVKRASASAGDGFLIFDNKRPRSGTTGNYINNKLYVDSTGAESGNVYDAVDFLSNGFKLRTGRTGANADGSTYVYAAFAENPFVTSTGIPTTAR